MSNADDVLAELKSIGALGRPKAPVAPSQRVDEVDVEEAAPEAPLVDQRGEAMVAFLTDALAHLEDGVEALSALREDLQAIRQIWTTEDLGEEVPVRAQEVLVRPSRPVREARPSRPPEAPVEPSVDEEARQRAIEAARRKIRGEDLTPDQRAKAWAEEDASATTVGQDRARPAIESGETTVGTLGTIKPSFPAEGEE